MSNKSGEYKSQTQYAFSVAEEKPKVIEPDPEAIIEDPPKKSDSDLKPKVFAFFSGLATKIKTKSEEIKQDLKKLGEELTKNNDGPIVEKEPPRPKQPEVPPWEVLNIADKELYDEIKRQILLIPTSRRNLLNAPPEMEIDFKFSMEEYLPMAMATLKEDQNLNTARFVLVPKSISEHEFWRNYFYRIHVIKLAFGLIGTPNASQVNKTSSPATPAKKTDNGEVHAGQNSNSDNTKKSDESINNNVTTPATTQPASTSVKPTEETTTSTKPEDDTIEFASDYYEGGEWTGDLKAELTKLGIDDDEIDIGDAVGDTLEVIDANDLEEELRKQIEDMD
jgi:hypothetical protein